MFIFHDSSLNTWGLITEKLPEKPHPPIPIYKRSQNESPDYYLDLERYELEIAALKQNALTVVNEELIAKGIDMDLETVRNVLWHGELIHWPGAYETKEKDIFVEAGGNYIHTETITVAILTLPEEKIEVHGTESGKLFIKPEDLFALSKVQETIKKAATRAEEKKNTMENMTKEQQRLLSDISEIDQLRTDKEMLKQALDHADAELASLRQQLKEREESIKELLPVAEERLKRIVNYDMPDYYRIRSGIQSSISRAKALLDKQ